MRRTISILVENRSGELARIVGLFSARGLNIESLTVAETLDHGVSAVTLVSDCDDRSIDQMVKQINKMVRVLHVTDVTSRSHCERELALINLKTESKDAMQAVLSLASRNRVRVAEVMEDGLILEATGEWKQINALLEELAPFGIRHVVRTGAVAVWRKPDAEVMTLAATNNIG